MAIEKSTGVTPTEQLLAELCDNTFLKLWTYPNPYKADGKELCDVMAVFENHVFLFFDRESRKFDNKDGDLQVQWNRWHGNVIERQLKTSEGAKRYILERPDEVYLDSKATILFPIPIPKSGAIIHNIIVAHGAAEACRRASSYNITGSLAMGYHKPGMPAPATPFVVTLDNTEPVHVLDTSNLEIILKELDTVADFTAYLMAKEEAIKKYDVLYYCGEEDLLGNYFSNFDKNDQKHFIGTQKKGINGVFIPEGEWLNVCSAPEYLRKKQANKISEIWDNLMQRTSQNALDDKLGGNGNAFIGESAIYEMAKESRLFRRIMSERIKEAIGKFPDTPHQLLRYLTLLPSLYKDKLYVFLQVHHPDIRDYNNDYRPKRRAMLEIACGVAKNKFPHVTKVIGIAIDAPKFTTTNSEDFILLNCEEWSKEDQAYYEEMNKGFRFLETERLEKGIISGNEFPKTNNFYKPAKIGRNEKCPCGSGRKYKQCCLN